MKMFFHIGTRSSSTSQTKSSTHSTSSTHQNISRIFLRLLQWHPLLYIPEWITSCHASMATARIHLSLSFLLLSCSYRSPFGWPDPPDDTEVWPPTRCGEENMFIKFKPHDIWDVWPESVWVDDGKGSLKGCFTEGRKYNRVCGNDKLHTEASEGPGEGKTHQILMEKVPRTGERGNISTSATRCC